MNWKPGDTVKLETEHFFMRSLKPEDADETYVSWWNDAEIQRGFNNKPRGWNKTRAQKHISSFNNINQFHLGIFAKDTSKLIGFFTLFSQNKTKTMTTNICLGDKSYWGKNVVLEVRKQTMDFIFQTLEMEKAESKIIGRNFSSIFNNNVLGYTSEGILRSSVPFVDGSRADIYLYGLLKAEWENLKDGDKPALEKLDKDLIKSEPFQQAKKLLSEATFINVKDIPDTASVNTWGSWDSLSHVRLILAIEAYLDKDLGPDAIVEISSLSDIAGFISKK